jgi:invasion protein IalB
MPALREGDGAMSSLANWVAAVSALLLLGAFLVGLAVRPPPERWPSPRTGRPGLPAIIPFTPQADFAGEHKYGLWTLYCRRAQPGAEIGAAPAAPAAPDLSADVSASIAAALRCVSHARIQVAAPGQPVRVVADFNVFVVGADRKPFVIMNVPARAKAGSIVNFQIDENRMFTAPVGECGDMSCRVQGELPQAALGQMLAGRELRLRLYPEETDPIDFGYPLHGFKESYAALAFAQPVPEVLPPPPSLPATGGGPPVE